MDFMSLPKPTFPPGVYMKSKMLSSPLPPAAPPPPPGLVPAIQSKAKGYVAVMLTHTILGA